MYISTEIIWGNSRVNRCQLNEGKLAELKIKTEEKTRRTMINQKRKIVEKGDRLRKLVRNTKGYVLSKAE